MNSTWCLDNGSTLWSLLQTSGERLKTSQCCSVGAVQIRSSLQGRSLLFLVCSFWLTLWVMSCELTSLPRLLVVHEEKILRDTQITWSECPICQTHYDGIFCASDLKKIKASVLTLLWIGGSCDEKNNIFTVFLNNRFFRHYMAPVRVALSGCYFT